MRKIIVSEFVTLDGVMEAPEKWQFPVSSTLQKAEWNNATLIKGNVAEAISKLMGTLELLAVLPSSNR
jgi:hypothetical protein